MSSDEASAKAGDLQELKRLKRLHDHTEKLKDLGFKEVDPGDIWVEKTCKEAARDAPAYMGCSKCRYSERGCARCVQNFVSTKKRTPGADAQEEAAQPPASTRRHRVDHFGERPPKHIICDHRVKETQQ